MIKLFPKKKAKNNNLIFNEKFKNILAENENFLDISNLVFRVSIGRENSLFLFHVEIMKKLYWNYSSGDLLVLAVKKKRGKNMDNICFP